MWLSGTASRRDLPGSSGADRIELDAGPRRRIAVAKWATVAPELAFLLVGIGAMLWARGRWLDPMSDPGSWWSLIWRIGNGEVLYRDVYLQYGPLSPYLLALGGRAFGFGAASILLLNAVPAMLAGLALLRATRGVLSTIERFAVAAFLLGVSVLAPGPGRLVWSYCPGAVHALAFSAVALALVRAERWNRLSSAWWAGILAGLAFCSKQEIGLAALAALAAPAAVHFRSGIAWIVRSVAGFLGVALLGAAFALWAAPVSVLRARNHLWPFELVPPGEFGTLARFASGTNQADWLRTVLSMVVLLMMIAGVVALLGALAAGERRVSGWLPFLALVVCVVIGSLFDPRLLVTNFRPSVLSMTVAFASFFLALFDRRTRERPFLIALSLFAGLIATRAAFIGKAGDPYTGIAHFATNATWVVFLCLQLPRLLADGEKASGAARRAWGVLVLVAGCWLAFTGARALASPDKVAVSTERGDVRLDPGDASFFRRIRASVAKGETALVLPEINALDVLFDLRSASPWPIHLPGWLDRDAERMLIARFERRPPDVVVLWRRETAEYGKRRLGNGYGEDLALWISSRYLPAYSGPRGTLMRKKT